MLLETAAAAAPASPWPVYVSLIVGLLAFSAAAMGVVQKWRADRRQHWWTRTQWALEKVASDDDETRTVGLLVLSRQLDSKLATQEDAMLALSVCNLIFYGIV